MDRCANKWTDVRPCILSQAELKEAVQISMGTEVSEDDITNIQALCDQVRNLERTKP